MKLHRTGVATDAKQGQRHEPVTDHHPDLAGLPPIEVMDAVAPEALPAAIAHCAAMLARTAARLAIPVPAPQVEPADELLDVRQAAACVQRSLSWMQKNGHKLPGFRQPGGKGCRVTWSRRALGQWMTKGARP